MSWLEFVLRLVQLYVLSDELASICFVSCQALSLVYFGIFALRLLRTLSGVRDLS